MCQRTLANIYSRKYRHQSKFETEIIIITR